MIQPKDAVTRAGIGCSDLLGGVFLREGIKLFRFREKLEHPAEVFATTRSDHFSLIGNDRRDGTVRGASWVQSHKVGPVGVATDRQPMSWNAGVIATTLTVHLETDWLDFAKGWNDKRLSNDFRSVANATE